jgi:hypothetical protein
MEWDKSSLRILVETCRRNGMGNSAMHGFITQAWGDVVSLRRVEQLTKNLHEGLVKKEDGRGFSRGENRTEDAIKAVKKHVKKHASDSLDAIALAVDIPARTVHRILTEDLGFGWKTAKWIPHALSDAQRECRVERCSHLSTLLRRRDSKAHLLVIDEKIVYHEPVNTKCQNAAWVPPGGDQPVVVRRSQFDPKFMVIVAITFTGKVLVQALQRGDSVNADVYIAFLRRVFHNFSRHVSPLQTSDILLMHGNARVHTSAAVRHFLDKRGVTVCAQPPYSPDTNACDRFAFRIVEEKRVGHSFRCAEEVELFVTDTLKSLSQDRLDQEFLKLQRDLLSIVDAHGHYL